MISVYRYGLLAPTEGADVVEQQIRAAHRYQNALIELERNRRAVVRDVLSVGPVAELDAQIAATAQELESQRAAIQAEKGATRKRTVAHTSVTRAVAARLKELRGLRRNALAAARLEQQAELRAVELRAGALLRALRDDTETYWGTYLKIEEAVSKARGGIAPPNFKRWDGRGLVAVQLQNRSMSASRAFGCLDRRLQLDLNPRPVPGRRGKPLPRVRLRVGSDERKGPIWAEWPMIYHRDLPEGAIITWATVLRERIATTQRWALLLTIEHEGVAPTAQKGAAVAVDLGWRRVVESGAVTTRACGFAATDEPNESELHVHPGVIGALRKADDIRSIRDKRINEIQPALAAWLRTCRSEVHRERMRFAAHWRAGARFAALAIWWRDHRTDGDDLIFGALEAWRKQDKHLWLWEAHARRKALARRLDGYRVFAADLARRYEILVLEKLDLRMAAEKPVPESHRGFSATASSQRTVTAPSELRMALINAFRTRGGTIVEVPASASAVSMLAEREGAIEKARGARISKFARLRMEHGGAWSRRSEVLESGGASA